MTQQASWLTPSRFIVVHVLLWWIIQSIAKPGLDSYGDMVEVFAWAQHWLLGSEKHPQFLPWITRIWFSIAPETVVSFYGLSALNLAVGMAGIAALGRAAGLNQRQVLVALALQALAFPYLTLAAKLNMNSILLAVWPWVAHAFLRLTQTQGRAQLGWAAWLGVISAAALMSKYYSAVLLVSLLGASLMPRLRSLWRGPAPFVFLAVLMAMLTPHLIWLSNNQEALAYAADQGAGGVNLSRLVKFALSPVIYWPIPMIIGLGWLYQGNPWRRFAALVRISPGDEVLWFCTAGPLLVTLGFGAVGLVEMSQPWAIPIGFAYPLLMLRNRTRPESRADRLPMSYKWIWPGLLALGIVYAVLNGQKGQDWHYMPEKASTAAILEGHASHFPDAPALSWAAAGNDAARLAFFAPAGTRPEALPDLPDRLPAYYPPRRAWKSEAGVFICAITPENEPDRSADCANRMAAWAAEHGLQSSVFQTSATRSGWRFPQNIAYRVSVVFVWP